MAMDETDAALLREIQRGVPVDHRPFAVLGERVGMSEQECLERIGRLKASLAIRQLCAIFNPRALGYQRSLVAMRVAPARIAEAAGIIGRHPGVSRIDQRNDPFNLWFTIALPPDEALQQVASLLHGLAKSEETLILPTLRLYTIGLKSELPSQELVLEHQEALDEEGRRVASRLPLTEQDLRFIRAMQEDLPLLELPYAVWAEQAEATEQDLVAWVKRMERLGGLHRIAAIVQEHPAPALANAMVAWKIPEDEIDAVGEQVAGFREAHACSRHPAFPNWPYPLLAMVDAETQAACESVAKRVAARLSAYPCKILFATRTYQQVRVKYFTPALHAWWASVGSAASTTT